MGPRHGHDQRDLPRHHPASARGLPLWDYVRTLRIDRTAFGADQPGRRHRRAGPLFSDEAWWLVRRLRRPDELAADFPRLIGLGMDVDVPLPGLQLRYLRIGQCRRTLNRAGEIPGEGHNYPRI